RGGRTHRARARVEQPSLLVRSTSRPLHVEASAEPAERCGQRRLGVDLTVRREMVDQRRKQAREPRRGRFRAEIELLARERQVLAGAHPRVGLATEPRVGELLDQSGEPAGMALDERGGEIQERVAPLAARGLAGETTKYLVEKPHGDLQVSSSCEPTVKLPGGVHHGTFGTGTLGRTARDSGRTAAHRGSPLVTARVIPCARVLEFWSPARAPLADVLEGTMSTRREFVEETATGVAGI